MKQTKNIIKRILRSMHDGSFAIKIVNRISAIKYVPSVDTDIVQFFQQNNPDKDISKLSNKAKKMFIELKDLFERIQIKTVVYVGANDGMIAKALDEAFPGLEFYLFEPIPKTYRILTENISGCSNMHCFNLAVGSVDEYADMNMDEFLPASSLLPYNKLAIEEFPFLGKQEKIKVRVKPMDNIINTNKIEHVDFLIMDIQGYEDKLLKGSEQTLKSCKAIMSELSLDELYTNSSTFNSVYKTLVNKGFSLRYLLNPLHGRSGRILQIDGIFVRDF